MKNSQEIANELKKFYGSATLYKHWLGLKYTEGIQYLAQEANCYWLLDTIASHQTKKLLSNPKLREFQIWHLQVKDNSGVLICEWDTNKEVLRQEIEYTDFALSHIKLYLVGKIMICNQTLLHFDFDPAAYGVANLQKVRSKSMEKSSFYFDFAVIGFLYFEIAVI